MLKLYCGTYRFYVTNSQEQLNWCKIHNSKKPNALFDWHHSSSSVLVHWIGDNFVHVCHTVDKQNFHKTQTIKQCAPHDFPLFLQWIIEMVHLNDISTRCDLWAVNLNMMMWDFSKLEIQMFSCFFSFLLSFYLVAKHV